jgi:hypothetical protein
MEIARTTPHNHRIERTRLSAVAASRVQRLRRAAHPKSYATFKVGRSVAA